MAYYYDRPRTPFALTAFMLLLHAAAMAVVGRLDPFFALPWRSPSGPGAETARPPAPGGAPSAELAAARPARAETAQPPAPGNVPRADPYHDDGEHGGGGAGKGQTTAPTSDADPGDDGCSWMEPRTEKSVHPLFPAFVAEVFEKVIVLCYKKSCVRHHPGGGAWPPAVQRNVIVQDGSEVDERRYRLYRRVQRGMLPGGRNPTHGTVGFFNHMDAMKMAAQLNASTILIMEADTVLSKSASEMFSSCSDIMDLVRAWRNAFSETPWQAVKLGARYLGAMEDERPGEDTVCRCQCTVPPAWRRTAYPSSRLTVCGTPLGKCDIRDSHAYALHHSAFPVAMQALREVHETLRAPAYTPLYSDSVGDWRIDKWYAVNLQWHHVLPMLAVQKDKTESGRDSERFRRACVLGDTEGKPPSPPE